MRWCDGAVMVSVVAQSQQVPAWTKGACLPCLQQAIAICNAQICCSEVKKGLWGPVAPCLAHAMIMPVAHAQHRAEAPPPKKHAPTLALLRHPATPPPAVPGISGAPVLRRHLRLCSSGSARKSILLPIVA